MHLELESIGAGGPSKQRLPYLRSRMLSKPMLQWNRATKTVLALVAIAAYFGLAAWSTASFDDFTPKGKVVVRLYRPYEKFGNGTHAVISHEWTERGSLADLADSVDNNERSPVVIYEDGRALGPAHCAHEDIAQLGEGRYSHWRGQGYVFSASDNSDPNSNGRHYWAVVP